MNIIDNEFIDDFTFTIQPDELTVLRKLYKDVIPSVNAIIEYINNSFDDEMKAILLSRFNELILDIMYEPNNELLKFFLKDKPSLEVPSFLIWNESAMSFEFNMNALVTATLCEDVNYPPAKNGTNATITNGKVVMLDDVQGSSGYYTVKPADATAVGFDRYKVLGIATQDIIKNTSGIITRLGMVNNIDTSGTPYGETWEEGDRLYLSPTVAGGMTNVRPTDSTKVVYIGTVFIKNSVNGSVYVDRVLPVSKVEIGLDKVDNVSTNDATPTFTADTVLTNIASGEKVSVLWGRVKKLFTDVMAHLSNTNNPHSTTASQVGLGNVDNTRDIDKPISTTVQSAFDGVTITPTIVSSTITAITTIANKVKLANGRVIGNIGIGNTAGTGSATAGEILLSLPLSCNVGTAPIVLNCAMNNNAGVWSNIILSVENNTTNVVIKTTTALSNVRKISIPLSYYTQ